MGVVHSSACTVLGNAHTKTLNVCVRCDGSFFTHIPREDVTKWSCVHYRPFWPYLPISTLRTPGAGHIYVAHPGCRPYLRCAPRVQAIPTLAISTLAIPTLAISTLAISTLHTPGCRPSSGPSLSGTRVHRRVAPWPRKKPPRPARTNE